MPNEQWIFWGNFSAFGQEIYRRLYGGWNELPKSKVEEKKTVERSTPSITDQNTFTKSAD